MDTGATSRPRLIYVTQKQKKKLYELLSSHPELIKCKLTQNFTAKDARKLWLHIASVCNSLPGARKTWKQWKKTWQDLKCKAKKKSERVENNGDISNFAEIFNPIEREAFTFKNVSSTTSYQETTESLPMVDNVQTDYAGDTESVTSLVEPESPPEEKLFTSKISTRPRTKQHNANNCYLNCDLITVQEQKKIQIKEDYLNFKKDYLRQKLKLMKEQTEALKSIAMELSKQ